MMSSQTITIINMISTKQNAARQIDRLAANRQLYATAKRIFGWQVFIGGPVAVICAAIALLRPDLKGPIAAWSLAVVVLDLFWLVPWQKSLKRSAAGIQEEFDCDVLGLNWNDLKAGKRPDPELVRRESEKYQRWSKRMPSLEDWYPPRVDELPIEVGRIVCQRANCWWDATQRRKYAAWLLGTVVIISIIICALALSHEASFESLILLGFTPLLPALLIALRQNIEQREAADRLDKLKEHCGVLWKAALSGKSKTALNEASRNLQDEILDNRRKAPPVLDFVFKRLRDTYNADMNYAAEQLISEAKTALKIR